MAGARIQRKPSFLWHGILILLPVAVLGIVSLASLRRDERAAEQDARQRAAESVQSLSRAIRSTVNDELHQFLTLQNVWTMELRSASQPSVTVTPDDRLAADIARWERNHPGLKLADLAAPQCELLADGRQLEPPEIPIAPVPPKWFRELTPKQKGLWEDLYLVAATNVAPRQAVEAFAGSGVSKEAAVLAGNLAATAPDQRIFIGDISESGVSFRGLALYRLLRNPSTTLSNSCARELFNEIFASPSFMAPALLELAETRTNGTDPLPAGTVRSMRQLWTIQSKADEWLVSLRHLPELTNSIRGQPWMHWTTGTAEEALAIFEPCTFQRAGNDADGVPLSGSGYIVAFVPRRVVEAIFAKELDENRYLVPGFARAVVSVQGLQLRASRDTGPAQALPILGIATQRLGKHPDLDAGTFDLTFLLTSREQMLSVEHRRAGLFILLILGTVVTAVTGLIAARRAFQRQLQLSEMKSNFVSSVSHELRAPIASVRLMAESLERGKIAEPQKQNEYFGFIVQECRRLSSLIENVLDFSRIEQGRKEYEFEPTDVVALVTQTVTLMQPYAAEKGVSLELETFNIQHSTSNIESNVDGKAIQQALVNLIDNAIKHSPKGETVTAGIEVRGPRSEDGGRKPEPEMLDASRITHHEAPVEDKEREQSESSFHHPPSTIHLSVSDHGPGIPPEEHEKIFERFYRRGSELRRETQGVGIGLSIVEHIVEAHGGRVIVRSAPGAGSRFTIELPLQQ